MIVTSSRRASQRCFEANLSFGALTYKKVTFYYFALPGMPRNCFLVPRVLVEAAIGMISRADRHTDTVKPNQRNHHNEFWAAHTRRLSWGDIFVPRLFARDSYFPPDLTNSQPDCDFRIGENVFVDDFERRWFHRNILRVLLSNLLFSLSYFFVSYSS